MNEDIVLKLTGITKDFHQGRSLIEVLKDVSLELKSGQMIAIVGSSGSGKSTLLHIAGLLDIPTKGRVEIMGNSFEKQSLDNAAVIRLNNLGFIYQYHHLLRDFTAQENAAMPLIIQGINKSEALDRAEVILSDLGLGKRLYNVPGELSGGEQQRVAIARAFINKPKIVLADEPTGNLDPNTAEDVFNMFLQCAQNENTAIIMVTHNMAIANRLNKVYKLDYSLLEVK
ncbi:MAG: ABC transporter ATP-binding protein [Rickettsiales bacterium]|nr:ABC transporter ATP-binding protein [Rickettsiales bacterium]MCA0254613.1 ABC transporter ATP-binding protein [Pseudomonadota bacterium]